jgi:hypothetical protein
MMIALQSDVRVNLAYGYTDMRRDMQGLVMPAEDRSTERYMNSVDVEATS